MAGFLAGRTVRLSIKPKSLVKGRDLGYARHMNIHRRSLCIFLVLLLILVRCVVPAHGEVPSAPSITIGAILPLTGSASNFGAIAQRGIELALEDLPPADRARTRVIYEDDGLVNARSATAARKLLSINKVDALITWSSGTALTVASILEASRVPQIAIASDPAVVREKSSPSPTGHYRRMRPGSSPITS
jgi:ABC-type branched-subunit amino acid transport system substrate-binding protein